MQKSLCKEESQCSLTFWRAEIGWQQVSAIILSIVTRVQELLEDRRELPCLKKGTEMCSKDSFQFWFDFIISCKNMGNSYNLPAAPAGKKTCAGEVTAVAQI